MNGNYNKHGPHLLIWLGHRWPQLVRLKCSWLTRKLRLPRDGIKPHLDVYLARLLHPGISRAGPGRLPRDWILGLARSAITRMPRDWICGLPRDGTGKLARDWLINRPRDATLLTGWNFRYDPEIFCLVFYHIRGKTRFRWRNFFCLNRYSKPVMGEVHPVQY